MLRVCRPANTSFLRMTVWVVLDANGFVTSKDYTPVITLRVPGPDWCQFPCIDVTITTTTHFLWLRVGLDFHKRVQVRVAMIHLRFNDISRLHLGLHQVDIPNVFRFLTITFSVVEYVKRTVHKVNPFLVLRCLEIELIEPVLIFLLYGSRKGFYGNETLQLVWRTVVLRGDILYPIIKNDVLVVLPVDTIVQIVE